MLKPGCPLILIFAIFFIHQVVIPILSHPYIEDLPKFHPENVWYHRSKLNINDHDVINHWPNGILYYEISPQFNASSRKIIHGAMKEISSKSCIQFIPRNAEKDYIYIRIVWMDPNAGCYTQVGKRGGKQFLTLDTSRCIQHGRVMHELFHALGFSHEHQRPDRDEYIEIMWNNIKKFEYPQFVKFKQSVEYSMGFPYDYGSITHYANISPVASIDTSKPIILPKKLTTVMGQRESLSRLDVKKINIFYKCT